MAVAEDAGHVLLAEPSATSPWHKRSLSLSYLVCASGEVLAEGCGLWLEVVMVGLSLLLSFRPTTTSNRPSVDSPQDERTRISKEKEKVG